ncbi:MAG: acyl-CoA thioesterase [Rhodocyclales bacterium]|nr:acyl-CoA thioesterase [Rhodocyclales bacterium]
MKIETTRTLVFTAQLPIRWGDLDALNHVNNTVYFRYMEQARIEWLEALGFTVERVQAEGPIIVNASCTFLIPLTYPGAVECRIFTGEPGRSSLPTFYELRRAGDETLYAEGASKIVWINNSTGKSTPLPEKLHSLFKG